jgi:hypothetical protein
VIGNYDAVTENGIYYYNSLYMRNSEYMQIIIDLNDMYPARKLIMSGSGNVTEYSLGTRSVTRGTLSADKLLSLWEKLQSRKIQIESGRKKRKAIAAVPRDW